MSVKHHKEYKQAKKCQTNYKRRDEKSSTENVATRRQMLIGITRNYFLAQLKG